MAGTLRLNTINSNLSSGITTAVNGLINSPDVFRGYTISKVLFRDETTICSKCQKDGKEFFLKIYSNNLSDERKAMLSKISKIKSDNIAEIIEFGEEDGKVYEIQKYYGQNNLSKSNVSYADIIKVIVPCLNNALAELHRSNIIHNDIKPENIILLDGVAVLVDYSSITAGAGIIDEFTLEYAAPEVIESGFVSTSSDYYALGVTLYELTVGSNPFLGMSSYDNLNTKKSQSWIISEIISTEISSLLNHLCLSNSSSRWQFSEISDWTSNIDHDKIINFEIKSHENLGTLSWNGTIYHKDKVKELIASFADNWAEAIEFLFSGAHDNDLKMYSPDIALGIQKAKQKFGNSYDQAFLEFLLNSSNSISSVYWRDFKCNNVSDLAVKMLNECFYSFREIRESESLENASISLFLDSAIKAKALSSYLQHSNRLDSTYNLIEKVEQLEADYSITTAVERKLEIAFELCYLVSGSNQLSLPNGMAVSSTEEFKKIILGLLSENSVNGIATLLTLFSDEKGKPLYPVNIWKKTLDLK